MELPRFGGHLNIEQRRCPHVEETTAVRAGVVAGMLVATFPHTGHTVDCLAYLAADETLTTAQRALHHAQSEAQAPLHQLREDSQRIKEAAWEAAEAKREEAC